MSEYYNAPRKTGLFEPESKKPFLVSRSKLENFIRCPRCFYLDRRLGVAEPPGFPFTLNSAVDHLLKKEFDSYRLRGEAHPLMKKAGLRAIPAPHPNLDAWRDTRRGVRVMDKKSNFEFYGAIDDLWRDENGEYIVADYKATAKDAAPTLDAEWQTSYKRQMEIYQWLLRGNGLSVSKRGFFVYANGDRSQPEFGESLRFKIFMIPYEGDDSWVEDALQKAAACLHSPLIPERGQNCDWCLYRKAAGNALFRVSPRKNKNF